MTFAKHAQFFLICISAVCFVTASGFADYYGSAPCPRTIPVHAECPNHPYFGPDDRRDCERRQCTQPSNNDYCDQHIDASMFRGNYATTSQSPTTEPGSYTAQVALDPWCYSEFSCVIYTNNQNITTCITGAVYEGSRPTTIPAPIFGALDCTTSPT
jgi:hypothetical protein